MWDPRFPELAAVRLSERHAQAASELGWPKTPGRLRRHLGATLVRLGERLATPAAPAGRRPASALR